jgi:hypothetical protein
MTGPESSSSSLLLQTADERGRREGGEECCCNWMEELSRRWQRPLYCWDPGRGGGQRRGCQTETTIHPAAYFVTDLAYHVTAGFLNWKESLPRRKGMHVHSPELQPHDSGRPDGGAKNGEGGQMLRELLAVEHLLKRKHHTTNCDI